MGAATGPPLSESLESKRKRFQDVLRRRADDPPLLRGRATRASVHGGTQHTGRGRMHPLRQERAHHPRQHISCAGFRERRRALIHEADLC